VLYGVAQLAGLDRSLVNDLDSLKIRDYVDNRLGMIWEKELWPETMRFSSEAITTTSDIKHVDLAATVGSVIQVYSADPRISVKVEHVPYFVAEDSSYTTGERLIVLNNTDPVIMEYRLTRPMLTGAAYSATATYSVNEQVYYENATYASSTPAGTGNFYTCAVATTAGEDPLGTAASWTLAEIPYIFQNYLIRGALSDLRMAAGETEAAMIASRQADRAMEAEVDKLLRQRHQKRQIQLIK